MGDPEYRFIEFEAFSRAGASRSAVYEERADAAGYVPRRPVVLGPGDRAEYVVQHVAPGRAGDYTQRHGPYAFWLYGRSARDVRLDVHLSHNEPIEASVPAS